MTCPRSRLIYPGAVGVYHCVSSYVRRAYVCGVDRASGANVGANVGVRIPAESPRPNPPGVRIPTSELAPGSALRLGWELRRAFFERGRNVARQVVQREVAEDLGLPVDRNLDTHEVGIR